MLAVSGTEYDVGDRLEELEVIRMPFQMWGKCRKPDLHHVLVLGTDPLLHMGNWVTELVYVREANDYRKLFIYYVQTLFLAVDIFQTTNNAIPGAIFKWAHQ